MMDLVQFLNTEGFYILTSIFVVILALISIGTFSEGNKLYGLITTLVSLLLIASIIVVGAKSRSLLQQCYRKYPHNPPTYCITEYREVQQKLFERKLELEKQQKQLELEIKRYNELRNLRKLYGMELIELY